ncbi:MAG: hypothetical protein PHP97_01345 [Candidatus Shapirobacteria bacterium]|nr:hypothetical protein [Candidatus Shapirobacteria bacterium]MDD3002702.1 hypothetical protein [Candidatus Shapirobacteria bacterium]MDD4383219.1 hypothetical protein [Candidatus Shapirobacteria bacterium]
MDILIFGRKDSIFVKELISVIHEKYNINFEIIDIFHLEHISCSNNLIKKIISLPAFLDKPLIRLFFSIPITFQYLLKIKKRYDICHIVYKKFQYCFLINLICQKGKKTIVTIFGSDFYKNHLKYFDRNFYNKVDYITFANEQTKTDFNHYYHFKFNNKINICPFGLLVLNKIDEINKKQNSRQIKKKLGYNPETIIIICGGNRSINEQHEKIINELSLLKNLSDIKPIVFIFPMTYGGSLKRVFFIQELISKKIPKLNTKIIKNYQNIDDVAQLRLITDIQINIRKTDQLSGVMLENMYVGGVIINGSWLPYNNLSKKNIYYEKISQTKHLHKKIETVINNIENYKNKTTNNHTTIKKLYHWNTTSKLWYTLYNK